MIKNFIFDYGDVLYKFDRNCITDNFCPDEADREIFGKAVFHRWSDTDAGLVSQKDYIAETLELLPGRLHKNAADALNNWPYIGVPLVKNHNLLKNLKKAGYGVHLLSNAPFRLRDVLGEFPIFSEFDSVTISAEIRLVKPNPEIYEYMLRKNNLNPEECFFIDDLEKNIRGAEACKIRGYVFDGDCEKLEHYIYEELLK